MIAVERRLAYALVTLLATGCSDKQADGPDRPRLNSKVAVRDVVFQSASLGRAMRYRVILPSFIAPGTKLSAVYLLHGGGGTFRDWSNYSDVAEFAESRLILIMPQGDYSYYVNSVKRPGDRYEDYIVRDLLSDAEVKFPIAIGRDNRAIAGVSMGGFGAIEIALRHPDLFAFAGGLSPAIDVARRPFSVKRLQQSQAFDSIFGSWNSDARHALDPFLIARAVPIAHSPYLFLSCGEDEALLPSNRAFATAVARQGLSHEFHVVPGGHDWKQWNRQVPSLFASMLQHLPGATLR
jgi:putative tributyrin esterase